MNKHQNQIIGHVISHVMISIEPGTTVPEETVASLIEAFSIMYPLTEAEKEEVKKILHARLAIRMDRGASIKDKNHVTWYYSAKKDLKTKFWDRYIPYLQNDAGFPPKVINSLDASTDEMMDLIGNPTNEHDFQRRGLVIGDVQSGKTATYTALINKAADSGYRVIILLTGTIEKLRKQTQGRLDEGFVGLDSAAFSRGKSDVLAGVGNYDSSISGWAVTSTSSDFNKSTAEKLSGQLSGINSPVLFVLKKNKGVLEKLEQWLKLYNANHVSNTSSLPMLLIDDEADNASVNTKGADDPAAINAGIRKLLKLFSKATYVGFTATPFANIFIDPDSDHDMLDDDLFPRDFIYALEAPDNYVGARTIFSEDGEHSYMLKPNDDCEDYLPEKHNKDFFPQELPLSLKQAIASFFIGNAVRDLRGQTTKHRSMLVNVSRFIAVQEKIKVSIDGYVRELQREIKNYYLVGNGALEYESFAFIKEVFDNEFATIPAFEFSWEDIQESLHPAIASIIVRTVNGGNAAKNLNYDEFLEDGLRIIAVGGLSLSRGLTLEGLSVSYFYRNSKMYDTLMQMGRWFGYRDGYADICQVWMGEGAIEWYRYISIAADELRREVRRMKEQNKTPKEFGLCVRSDKTALLVTARNKMKTAKDYSMTISLNGKVIETPYLHTDSDILGSNLQLTEIWLNGLADEGFKFEKSNRLYLNNYQISNVSKAHIIEYLSAYKSHYLNMDFQTDNLVELMKRYEDGTVDNWDILIAEGEGSPRSFCGHEINLVKRNFGIKEESRALQMSDKRSRLGDANFAKGGLTKEEVEAIERPELEYQKRNNLTHKIPQNAYFQTREVLRNPLLVIYPVELSPVEEQNEAKRSSYINKKEIASNLPAPIIGLSIGIPMIDGRDNKTIKYKITLQKYKELFEIEEDYEEVDETLSQEEVINNV